MPDDTKKPQTMSLQELLASKGVKPITPKEAKKPFDPFAKITGISDSAVKKAEATFERENVKISKPITNPLDFSQKPQTEDTSLDAPIISLQTELKKLEYDESQQRALTNLKRYNFGCLIGAAGTGKTTVTKELVAAVINTIPTIDIRTTYANYDAEKEAAEGKEDKPIYNVAIGFVAFTGRAVEQMKKALPKEYWPLCNTGHGTLGYMPSYEEVGYDQVAGKVTTRLVFRPTFTAARKLPFKVIFLDEAGMFPIPLWNELMDALPSDCRVYLIGDINQLPPVQGRSVLGFAMTKWPTFALEKIHRQAADNPIIANAHKILTGFYPQKVVQKFDMVGLPDGSTQAFNKIIAVIQQLSGAGMFDYKTDALITPMNGGNLGQILLNERLLMHFNPERKEQGITVNKRFVITAGFVHVTLAVGDKVMLLQNDRKRGLNNGMIGFVTDININGEYKAERSTQHFDLEKIQDGLADEELDLGDLMAGMKDELMGDSVGKEDEDKEEVESSEKEDDLGQRQASHIAHVKFDNGQVIPFKTAGDYKKLTHAYAFTCHKSQGGEYPTVIIICHGSQSKMMCREWLYTAVTRARERVILLYNDRGLGQALKIQRIKGKSIAEKAKSFLDLQDRADTNLPNLPEVREV